MAKNGTKKQSAFAQDIAESIKNFDLSQTKGPTGKVITVGDGIALVDGLADVSMGEIVEIGEGVRGLALNLNDTETGIVILDDPLKVTQGDMVRATGTLLSVEVNDKFLGRVVNVLGEAIDGKEDLGSGKAYPLEKVAPGVMTRKSVDTPLQTGVKAIDAIIPIGRGQRELIIGDKTTGKSAIALSTIINQKDEDVICVYVAIGQKRSFVSQTVATLEEYGAMDHTIIVAATASDPAAQQYIAPYAGTAIAEYFLDKGKDVLVVYDDLTKHAWAYREISLLLRRPSGREAYPGDVFYLHSRLLERACRLNEEHGGGSITALPIIETQANDVSAYIPTNVISITDGQIYLEADLFNSGQRPAINVGRSVSRVGSAAQIKAMKQVAGQLRLDLAQYRELAAFAQFSSDLDAKTQQQLDRGRRMTELLKQHWENPMHVIDQVIAIWAGSSGNLDQVKLDHIKDWEAAYIDYMHTNNQPLLDEIARDKKISDEIMAQLPKTVEAFNSLHPDWIIEDED